MRDIKKTIERKLKWVNKRGKSYFDKDSERFSVHGAWQKGYYEGILSVLEDLQDIINEEREGQLVKNSEDS